MSVVAFTILSKTFPMSFKLWGFTSDELSFAITLVIFFAIEPAFSGVTYKIASIGFLQISLLLCLTPRLIASRHYP